MPLRPVEVRPQSRIGSLRSNSAIWGGSTQFCACPAATLDVA